MSTEKPSREKLMKLEEALTSMYQDFNQIFMEVISVIIEKLKGVQVGNSGLSILPHLRPMATVGHIYLTEKYYREIKETYTLKLYDAGDDIYKIELYVKEVKKLQLAAFKEIKEVDKKKIVHQTVQFLQKDFETKTKE